ncbi:MAG: SUF system Fe-S cluster assembly protein [Planctomycetota bacterium]
MTSEESKLPADSGCSVTQLKEAVIAAIKTCYDPEIPVDIYELGLIYKVDLDSEGTCHVDMTLTSPACPVAGTLPGEVEQKIATVDGVTSAKVEVVWDPPWTQDRMSEVARLELGFF